MEVRRAWGFLCSNPSRFLIVCALILVPCFWHKRLEAGDLPSHTYNAWLAHLIAQGQAPGLYIESRWNNILVDVTLEKLAVWVGFLAAERILAVVSVRTVTVGSDRAASRDGMIISIWDDSRRAELISHSGMSSDDFAK